MGYYDSTARKLNTTKKRVVKTKKVSKTKAKAKKKNNFVTVLYVVSIFSMLLFLAYRNNVISEKNIESINLKKQVDISNSNLASIQTNIIQNTDLIAIEEYAKQQLGMQKPDKSQIVYIDTSSENDIVKNNENNFFTNIVNSITNYFKNI